MPEEAWAEHTRARPRHSLLYIGFTISERNTTTTTRSSSSSSIVILHYRRLPVRTGQRSGGSGRLQAFSPILRPEESTEGEVVFLFPISDGGQSGQTESV